jgi:hypothetical protein
MPKKEKPMTAGLSMSPPSTAEHALYKQHIIKLQALCSATVAKQGMCMMLPLVLVLVLVLVLLLAITLYSSSSATT